MISYTFKATEHAAGSVKPMVVIRTKWLGLFWYKTNPFSPVDNPALAVATSAVVAL
jgi:hypothetical protein